MRILNLYAGIGGNRRLWDSLGDFEITAVEWDEKIAKIYSDFFPKDKMIITDAHQYLLEHFKEYDFIWSSPPCPSHSKMRKGFSVVNGAKPIYPDMKLYEEILFLQGYFKGKYAIENVISWYEPLIIPLTIQRHYFWCNFSVSGINLHRDILEITRSTDKEKYSTENEKEQVARLSKKFGFDLEKYKGNKKLWFRNCVEPELGKHILNCAINKVSLF